MPTPASSLFSPITLGALYPGIERGLTADVLTTRALGGQAYPVCTSHIIAGHGRVTDVLEVPADTVAAQLEHLFATVQPTGAKVGVIGSAASVEVAFRLLGQHLQGPLVLDLTLSGPSGEDLADSRVREALKARLPLPDLVTLRRVDAELLVGMEIQNLDDAQVAVQRLARLGARVVLLRAGTIPQSTFDDVGPYAFHADLFFDGTDFALFEAPALAGVERIYGASSALTLTLLHGLWSGMPPAEAMQKAKAFVTDALRLRDQTPLSHALAYFLPVPDDRS